MSSIRQSYDLTSQEVSKTFIVPELIIFVKKSHNFSSSLISSFPKHQSIDEIKWLVTFVIWSDAD